MGRSILPICVARPIPCSEKMALCGFGAGRTGGASAGVGCCHSRKNFAA